jgi:NTE family protein
MSDRPSIENVLLLQGGGSLGAFGCGVFKALVKNNIKIHIVAGTSIGGLNASIIAGSKTKHPEKEMEQFWYELAEGSSKLGSPFTDWLSNYPHATNPNSVSHAMSTLSFYKSALQGNEKVFVPRWRPEYLFTDPEYLTPNKWTYLFDHSPLIKTLEKYVDFNKLQPNGKPNTRLIITAVNVLTAEPLIFDSAKQQISPKHILATTGYPTYYFKWVEVEKGVFAWDGSLLSNTPLREVIDASPVKDKRIFLVENYPKYINKLPENLHEIQHRARDIMYSDKTIHNVQMSKAITYYLRLIDDLYNMLERNFNSNDKREKENFEKIRKRYRKVSEKHGAEIKSVHYITRSEDSPSLYENADFSKKTVRNSIKDGELKTNEVLKNNK